MSLYPCEDCPRRCRSGAGLASHRRARHDPAQLELIAWPWPIELDGLARVELDGLDPPGVQLALIGRPAREDTSP